jgi:hypothetical protein
VADFVLPHWSVQRAELHNLLRPRNAHEDGKPVVYGYIRTREPRPSYVMACRRALARYCDAENMRIGQVFVDQAVADDMLLRLGFSALADVLRLIRPAFSGQRLNVPFHAACCRFRYSTWTSCGVL